MTRKNLEYDREIYEALGIGPKTFTELCEIVPRQALVRRLDELRGLWVVQKENLYYRHDLLVKPSTQNIEHSRYVSDGLDLLLQDFGTFIFSERIHEGLKTGQIDAAFKDLCWLGERERSIRHDPANTAKIHSAKEHLKSGYPAIDSLYFRTCELEKEAQKWNAVPVPVELRIATVLNFPPFLDSHSKLAAEIGRLRARVDFGYPIQGKCGVCKAD
jgi:hypothetical protein